jgi:hypothetical protein
MSLKQFKPMQLVRVIGGEHEGLATFLGYATLESVGSYQPTPPPYVLNCPYRVAIGSKTYINGEVIIGSYEVSVERIEAYTPIKRRVFPVEAITFQVDEYNELS